jgi:hypothetical protein
MVRVCLLASVLGLPGDDVVVPEVFAVAPNDFRRAAIVRPEAVFAVLREATEVVDRDTGDVLGKEPYRVVGV